ncbi:asparagine synthase (glutamine-hydrolyzing) [Falsiroseomonas selenitidurans]|uniref:asparagine synthase (glutamine-hydrolyzing) n=1 Tax=Falsiroseomonas selenitidurans TaxID=2716335 RepID=A0ABX1DYK9_9PROT|nr:asparagine synthase (glutamine-hydrolyzing) [Falsiroseomonas selenitidurans]NKC29946.1 asparagine synthase (glutamine-hydrolyzing) [Falsiroseomonas selenitidurans]
MCGIAGLVLRQGMTPDSGTLGAMLHALGHRGPDGEGVHIADNVGLAHNRLAIIDLVTGDQPLHAGPATLVANGEVYNHIELREAHALVCQTGSDCEPPLHLYRREGAEATALALRGMYAIALHDRAARRVVLTRDPFGIKPLYIAEVPGGIAFASQPSALLAAGLMRPVVRAEAREELLQLQFTTGAETIFAGITRVLPGETVVIADGAIVERHRRAALPTGAPVPMTEEEALARLDAAFENSVRLHQRSDVPFGLFLSGGIDSGAVLAMMARLNSQPVRAFTASFDVPGAADERAAAEAAAKAHGAQHTIITVTEAEVWRELPKIVAAMDDPAADYAIIPTWFLARQARQAVKVVLSGEGGDELFAGYGRYRSAMRPWWLWGRRPRATGAFDHVKNVLREAPRTWRDGITAAEAATALPGRTRLQAAQAADIADWLPNDLLAKLDRCLMAHGVEGRTPFLDPVVAELAFRLPDSLKLRGRSGKWLLRAWSARHVKGAQPFAAKQGFTVPVAAWIGGVGDRLGPLVAAQPGVAEVARPDRVIALFRNAAGNKHRGFAAWHLLFYALWHRAHVEARPVEGDVWQVLGG